MTAEAHLNHGEQPIAQRLAEHALKPADLVPGTLRLEVATAQPGLEATYDLVLYSEFADRAALDAYQNHPTHVAVKPFLRAVVSERQCMDYEV